MSERLVHYKVPGKSATSIEELRKRRCCLPYSDVGYQAPTGYEIESFLALVDWSNNYFAEIVGVHYSQVKGNSTVRRWKSTNPDSIREIPYSAWRLALIEGGIVSPLNDRSTN